MTEKQAETKTRRPAKAERLHVLAQARYAPHKATRWPYLLHGDEQFKFEGPERRRLLADLRAAWRERYPEEAPPSAQDLNAAVDDLRRLAEHADPGPADAQDQAAELVSAHGISEVPNDRGLNLITRMEDCPLQDGYVIPEPYIVAPDGIHLMKDDGAGYARVAWSWLFPVRVYRRPGRRPAGRTNLAGRAPVGQPPHPAGHHQERPEAGRRGGGRRAARHRGRGQAGGALAGRGRGG